MKLLETDSASQLLQNLLSQRSGFNAFSNDKQHECIQVLLDESVHHQYPHWAAHMSPALAPYSSLGQHIATLHGGNLLSAELYPALKEAEQETLQWLCQHFHQPNAHFTHGSSYGNLEGLWKAREAKRSSNNIVYASDATHYSVAKACQILGLNLRTIHTSPEGRLDIDALTDQCRQNPPLAIVLNMGTTATGVIDPLEECIAVGDQYQTWIHIDAAWGGALMFSKRASQFESLKYVDSISFDPHKSLFQPKPSSVLFCRTKSLSLDVSPAYLETSPLNVLPGSYGGELFLPLWLNLKLLGSEWFVEQTGHRLQAAQHLASMISKQFKWTVIEPETGIVCFTTPTDVDLSALVEQGVFSTVGNGQDKMYRAVFASSNTDAEVIFTALCQHL